MTPAPPTSTHAAHTETECGQLRSTRGESASALDAAVQRILASRLAPLEALLADLDEVVEERRAGAAQLGPDDRAAFVHFTAGLSEARDRLRTALHPSPETDRG